MTKTKRQPTVFDQEHPDKYISPSRGGIEPKVDALTEVPDLHERFGAFVGLGEMSKRQLAMVTGLLALTVLEGVGNQPISRAIVGTLNRPAEVNHPYKVKLHNQITPQGTMVVEWGGDSPTKTEK